MQQEFTEVNVSFSILLNALDLDFIEKYRSMAKEKGLDMSFDAFVSLLLSTGSIPHLKRQAAFYIGGEIID